ncbi:hypothetical protein ABZX85_44235 [Streptomyces sp. NPDC004539]|uniref:hypothetical protein n=1 Tax=Streptomyces sp. NPDC004539 TaxID=3154280 RepID=UPI0033AA0490
MGHFAFADSLDEDTLLELTAATLAQQPDLEDADHITERAARTPRSPAAQLIAAAALDHGPAGGYRRSETIRHAATLYANAPAENTPERGFAHEFEQRLFASLEGTEAAAESNVDLRRALSALEAMRPRRWGAAGPWEGRSLIRRSQ